MSRNYSSHLTEANDDEPVEQYRWVMLFILPIWVFISFFTAQLIISAFVLIFSELHISIISINRTVLSTTLAVFLYLITLLLAIGLPWLIRKRGTDRSDVGFTRYPIWADIMIAPAGFIVYIICSSILILLATNVLPWFDVNQVQDTGFGHLTQNYEYVLAFVTLVVLAPIAEEVLFRGYLYGKLKKYVPVWAAIIAASLLFGAIHGAWNLAIDTFVLSVVLCLLRESTGSIWSSILLHMIKNGVAYYILFIIPALSTTMGG